MADRVELFYGQSGTGKSEAIAAVVRAVAESLGLRSRLLIGDGSKATYQDLVDAGIADVLDYTTRDYPQSTLQLLTEGYWPEDPDDPKSPLVAPDPKKMREFGVYGIEGLSVGSLYVMGDNVGGLSWRGGQGEKIGQDSPIRIGDGTYVKVGHREEFKPAFPGAMQFGANPPSHYNVTQRRMLTYVDRSKVLPVKFVIWTAHERAVEDKISKEVIIGPEVAGGALTANLQRIFNNTLHFAHANKRVRGQRDEHTEKQVDDLDVEYRIYTRDHFSPDGNVTFKFKAVTRAVPAAELKNRNKEGVLLGMPPYLTSDVPGQSILDFYGIVKEYTEMKRQRTQEAFEKARAEREAA